MGASDDMPEVGETVYVSTLHCGGSGVVQRIRRDGKLVVLLGQRTVRVRRENVRRRGARTSPSVQLPPAVDVPPPPAVDTAPMSGAPSPKVRTPRDRGYLDWLRLQPCVACGFPHGCDPSHHGRHGLGIKASDHDAVSMCRRCHDHWHATYRVFARADLDDEATERWLKEAAREQLAAYTRHKND